MIERLQAVPGVRGHAVEPTVLTGGVNGTGFVVQGRPSTGAAQRHQPRQGRGQFLRDDGDSAGPLDAASRRATMAGPRVAVINEAAVRKFFPNENPLGQRFGSTPETSSQFESSAW